MRFTQFDLKTLHAFKFPVLGMLFSLNLDAIPTAKRLVFLRHFIIISFFILGINCSVNAQSMTVPNSKDSLNMIAFKKKMTENRQLEFEQIKHLIHVSNKETSQEEAHSATNRKQMIQYFGVPDIQVSPDQVGYYLKGRFNSCCVIFYLDTNDNIKQYTFNQCE